MDSTSWLLSPYRNMKYQVIIIFWKCFCKGTLQSFNNHSFISCTKVTVIFLKKVTVSLSVTSLRTIACQTYSYHFLRKKFKTLYWVLSFQGDSKTLLWKVEFEWGSPNTEEKLLKYSKISIVHLNDSTYYSIKPIGKDWGF